MRLVAKRNAEARARGWTIQVSGSPASRPGRLRAQWDLAFTAVREQQASLLLDRMELLGDGATEAARRRDWAVRIEAVAVKERRAQDVCLKQGRAIRRHGFGKLD